MRHAIVGKLEAALAKHIRSEQQVVYIMVELRKLLELDELAGQFPSVAFHSDWVVHPKLSRLPALRVLDAFNERARYFHGLGQMNAGDIIVEDEAARNAVNGIVGLDNFMGELTTILQRYHLPLSLTQDWKQWRAFLKYYGEVIKDCPLLCSAKDKPFIDQISVEVSDLSKESTRASGFVLQVRWKWQNKKTKKDEYESMFF